MHPLTQPTYDNNAARAGVSYALSDAELGIFRVVPERTFGQVADAWLDHIRGSVASTTYDRYHECLVADVLPIYGDRLMSDLGECEAEVERFVSAHADSLGGGSLQVARTVLASVIRFADGAEGRSSKYKLKYEATSYEAITEEEMRAVLVCARRIGGSEMLAAVLALYCGVRLGELAALGSDDVIIADEQSGDSSYIYIHRTLHRVKNPDLDSTKKTTIVIEELPRKSQIRRVNIPTALVGYVREYMKPGELIVRKPDGTAPVDTRTLELRLERLLGEHGLRGVTYERLRKTYVLGQADESLLRDVFSFSSINVSSDRADNRYAISFAQRLTDLRTEYGVSQKQMCVDLGFRDDYISDIESRRVLPEMGAFFKICDYLGVSPREFF